MRTICVTRQKTNSACRRLPFILFTFIFLSLPSCSDKENFFDDISILCFGDSLTASSTYPLRISFSLGCLAINCGIGGTQLERDATNTSYAAMSMSSIADAITSKDWTNVFAGADSVLRADKLDQRNKAALLARIDYSTINVFTLFFGTNDFANNRPIGLNSDTTPETFKGAINYVITKLQSAYPSVQLIFFAPVWRGRIIFGDGKESNANPNSSGIYLIEYVDALKEVGALHNVDVFDTYRLSDINASHSTKYLSDGLHLTEAGGKYLGALFAKQLMVLIKKTH